jgi:hypothetical protein
MMILSQEEREKQKKKIDGGRYSALGSAVQLVYSDYHTLKTLLSLYGNRIV